MVKVYRDEGISGSLFDRPAMKELIAYLDENPTERFVIIFNDLARFARNLSVHLKLKTELISRGVRLECPNFNFEDTPEGEFIENVLASKAQLDRQQNRRQVIQKMKARLDGHYVDRAGVEPAISAMRMRRITNCANGPCGYIVPNSVI